MAAGSSGRKLDKVYEIAKALADPQRVAIVRLVHERELPAGEIAEHFQTTRQTTSQHLRLLTNAGLLTLRRDGTRRLYRVNGEAFGELKTFVDIFWNNRLSSLKRQVETDRGRSVADDDAIVREIYIDASPEETFPYLTEGDRYRLWMGVSAELDPRPGGIFKVDPNGRDVISGEFVEVVPPHRIVFTWGYAEPGRPIPAGSSTVEIDLIPQGRGTLLRLRHRGLAGKLREDHAGGWTHYLRRLTVAATGGDPGRDPMAVPSYRHG